jgi:transcription elongation factor Elf1
MKGERSNEKKKPMKRCPNCNKKLSHTGIQDFGKMIFIECKACKIIWDHYTAEIKDEL